MFEADENGVIARIHSSLPRRAMAYGVLGALGSILIYLPLVQPPSAIGTVFMLAFGVFSFWVAGRMYQSAKVVIELTADEVRDTEGRVLAKLSEIDSVERGAFALKSSNGFTMVMQSKKPRTWVPGLWWRLGRRVSVGGITSAAEAKYMAEQIALRIKA